MHPLDKAIYLTRREFFTSTASGIGLLALSSMLQGEGLLAAEAPTDPLAPRAPHFAPKAKNCIFIFMEGAPSQIDLFDPKPKLNELHGQPLPESMTKNVRFAFIKKETARLMGSPRTFAKHGQCGMEFSDLLPHMAKCADDLLMVRSMHTDQFNHHPAQLVMHCGRAVFGLPTMGAWMNYGLGSESRNLPGYVVLSAGRGTSGGASLWQSGFLPSVYAGVQFRSQGAPVLNLENPAGLPPELQRAGLDTLAGLNEARFEQMRDPEIQSRIAAYELAFRMQSAAPELIDLSKEDPKTLEAYGVKREDLKVNATRAGGPGQYKGFATNCLLARRLVERGAVCECRPRVVGPSLESRQRTRLQRRHERPARRGAHPGFENARAARRDACRVVRRIRPHAARRKPRREQERHRTRSPPECLHRAARGRRDQRRAGAWRDGRDRLVGRARSGSHQ